ncbi:MAG: hypothetical protein QNL05_05250 [Gammaproteobacteria bacterium]|nr:hypothetical protein [Gammaproteobacteria bacterium]MDX2486988.1 hypothetical protein [Gammaproteobacteria bacterium]
MKVLASIAPHLFLQMHIINVPEDFRRIGAEIEAGNDKGEPHLFYVTSIENGTLSADGMAGHTVNFPVTIVSTRRATDEELPRGIPDRDRSVRMFQ